MGRSHFSFGGERKVCKRKPAARRLREKALYCPFLKEGVRNVARSTVGLPTWTFVRARAHSFPLSKRARLFPSAAYRRSVPPQLAAGIRIPCKLGCFDTVGKFCGVDEWADFLHPVGCGAGLPPLQGGMLQCGLEIFATQKASGIFKPCWPQIAEKRPVFFSKTQRFLNSKNKLTRKERLGDLFHVLHGSSKEGLCTGTTQAVKVFGFSKERSIVCEHSTILWIENTVVVLVLYIFISQKAALLRHGMLIGQRSKICFKPSPSCF